jgi:anti-anti-sigma regulatory factor
MDEVGSAAGDGLTLSAVSDLVQAGSLKASIEHGLGAGRGLRIDASSVQRISSPCLQVLIAGVAAFATKGGPSLMIENPSAPFLEAATVLGLAEALRLD